MGDADWYREFVTIFFVIPLISYIKTKLSLRYSLSSSLMATSNQEAMDTFMSITGASDAVAVQKLEVIRITHLYICFFFCYLRDSSCFKMIYFVRFGLVLEVPRVDKVKDG